MVISKRAAWMLILVSSAVSAREAATPAACQAAGTKAPITEAKEAVARDAKDLRAQFRLADAWSEAGCFNDALRVLIAAQQANPADAEVETRLRVARSVVGEEHFFDNLDLAEDEARLKRAMFRCRSLSDTDACAEALRARPDDANLWSAQGDALMHANRFPEALAAYRHSQTLKPDQAELMSKITTAQSQMVPPAALDSASLPLQIARVPEPRTAPSARARSIAVHREATFDDKPGPRPRSAGDSNIESESHSH